VQNKPPGVGLRNQSGEPIIASCHQETPLTLYAAGTSTKPVSLLKAGPKVGPLIWF
jgi:hypothetical protein